MIRNKVISKILKNIGYIVYNNKKISDFITGVKMSINQIFINDFSVFKEMKIDFCKGINVIIGENG